MMPVTISELCPNAEACVAALHETQVGGESYTDPLLIGYYPNSTELWIEREGHRVNLPDEGFDSFVRQIRRARKMAKEGKQP